VLLNGKEIRSCVTPVARWPASRAPLVGLRRTHDSRSLGGDRQRVLRRHRRPALPRTDEPHVRQEGAGL